MEPIAEDQSPRSDEQRESSVEPGELRDRAVESVRDLYQSLLDENKNLSRQEYANRLSFLHAFTKDIVHIGNISHEEVEQAYDVHEMMVLEALNFELNRLIMDALPKGFVEENKRIDIILNWQAAALINHSRQLWWAK